MSKHSPYKWSKVLFLKLDLQNKRDLKVFSIME